MEAGLRALLDGILDYAGVFPPAGLPVGEALRHFAAHRGSPDAGMLARFVAPAGRLAEIAPAGVTAFGPQRPLVVSAIGRPAPTVTAFLANAREDLAAVADFERRAGGTARVDVFEVRLPDEAFGPDAADALEDVLHGVDRLAAAANLPDLKVFYELPLRDRWRALVADLTGALREFNEAGRKYEGEHFPRVGFKLRCGGAEPAAFPTPDQVAWCLRHCLENRVAFKATAGLHHPLPRRDATLGVTTHGFVNVFAGGVLAQAAGLGEAQLARLLQTDDPAAFRFDADGLAWGAHRATVEDVRHTRQQFMISFGSCSFDEPVADLRSLGWLGAGVPVAG